MEPISERIILVRKKATDKKLSQEDFAKSLGMTRSNIANLEDAENRLAGGIPESTLLLICKTYNVSYDWLKYGTGDMFDSESPTEKADRLISEHASKESEFARAIIRAFIFMPDSEWERVRDMIDEIKAKKRRG